MPLCERALIKAFAAAGDFAGGVVEHVGRTFGEASPPSPSPIRWERVADSPGEVRAAHVEIFHRRDNNNRSGINGVFAVRDGGDVKDGIRLGQRVIAGVVAERAFANVSASQAGQPRRNDAKAGQRSL